jgi:hypothetical protein
MTELEHRERHEAETGQWFDLVSGMTASEYLTALDRLNGKPANDDAAPAANDNIEMDEAA